MVKSFSAQLKKLKAWFTLRNLIIFVMPVSLATLIVMLLNLSQTVEHLSNSLIRQTAERTELELNDFFKPVINNLYVTRDWGLSGTLDTLDAAKQNPRFIPLLNNYPQVSSMLIGNSLGSEYMLLRKSDHWVNRCTRRINNQPLVYRMRWNYDATLKGKLLEKWKDTVAYDPRVRPWYKAAIANPNPLEPAWTEPYTFFTTKDPGITVSTRWKNPSDTSLTYVVAFDIMLTDISVFTTSLKVNEHGKAFVLTQDHRIVGLPRDKNFNTIDSIKRNVLKPYNQINIPELIPAIESWKQKTGKVESFPFQFEREKWWAGITEFKLGAGKSFYIGVIVPEADFMAEVHRTRTVITLGFILVIVLTLLVIRGYNQKRKANELLARQNEEIRRQKEEIQEQHNEITRQKQEITNSIKYASRIQQALLSTEEQFRHLGINHMILFLPRDIVSGDFYFFNLRQNHLIVAAADCTGHGVPGAFMSMLGISFLTEICSKSDNISASGILNQLRYKVMESLHQTGKEGESKDGMDIALAIINFSDQTLQFAGANNPLYLIRKTKAELSEPWLYSEGYSLLEIKADKMPIGIHERSQNEFSLHTMELFPGDRIYLFSDGYADQFGGNEGKKYMYKNLKRLLLKIQIYDMEQQKTILFQEHKDWKGQHEQLDDILILGIEYLP